MESWIKLLVIVALVGAAYYIYTKESFIRSNDHCKMIYPSPVDYYSSAYPYWPRDTTFKPLNVPKEPIDFEGGTYQTLYTQRK
jgi:hypothetical protein